MELKLNLISEDYITLPIPQKYKENITNLNNSEKQNETMNKEIETIIKEEIKKNNLFLGDITNQEYFEVNIKNNNKNDNKKEIKSDKNYDYIVEIQSKDKLKEEIEKKINSCMEKEKILMNKQNELKKISDDMKIDENLLEKKLIKLSMINKEEYEPIIDQLVSQVLDYDNFKIDSQKVQQYLINYRESLILGNCFKIYLKRINGPLLYMISKYIIFLNNEKLFQCLNKINIKITKIIIDEIFDFILKKIINNKIFYNHKEEFENNLNYYKEVCYLYPILKYFDKSQENNIFELDNDLHLNISEFTYDQMSRIDNQIPKRKGLNVTLSYFKEHSNIGLTYAMCLRRILLIHQKYKTNFPNYKKSSFLYD